MAPMMYPSAVFTASQHIVQPTAMGSPQYLCESREIGTEEKRPDCT